MIQIKKTILTLVALLAVTTGAWAEEATITLSCGTTEKTFEKAELPWSSTAAILKEVISDLAMAPGIQSITGGDGKVVKNGNENFQVTGTFSGKATVDVSYVNTSFHTSQATITVTAPAAEAPITVEWNASTKTGSFTMPGGNVTLEPEYYPQAALAAAPTAINDVPATTDGTIVNAGTVKNIGETTDAQGTLMYYAVQSETAPDAPDYDNKNWSDKVPTAADFNEGNVYVWYYVKGNDGDETTTFSDGAITKLGESGYVTLAAAPTYAVTFADDTAEPTLWTASPNAGVKKGTAVTVTYTGTKKVIGVKAEKKAKVTYTLLSAATKDDIGKVVCAAGHLHDAKTAVPDGCTAVGILGKVTSTGGHGLILALNDATSQYWNTINGWTSASYAGTTLKVLPDDAARGTNLTSYTTLGETAVSNWAVAQKSDYAEIFPNLGSTTGNNNGYTYDDNVNAYITTGVGGAALDGRYWSTTEDSGNYAWHFRSTKWSNDNKGESHNVRPVLGF